MEREPAARAHAARRCCPGYVATGMQERELSWEARIRGRTPEAVRDVWIADMPLRRLEAPEDVALAVAFLAAGDARFVTGEALAVNGGAFMDSHASKRRRRAGLD
jgi:NAD(P)-dependent dehydrogenase (short-subunit alcohol dehydrogenase family)